MSRLGDLILLERTRQKLTRKQVAKKCGVSEGYIKDVEEGRRIIQDDQARRILKTLGTSPMPPDMNDTRPGMDGETPDPSQLPQGMGGGNMRRDEMPDAMQNAAEEAAELAIEEPVPTGLQPVSPSAWVMLAACAAALVLGILIAVKYRQ